MRSTFFFETADIGLWTDGGTEREDMNGFIEEPDRLEGAPLADPDPNVENDKNLGSAGRSKEGRFVVGEGASSCFRFIEAICCFISAISC